MLKSTPRRLPVRELSGIGCRSFGALFARSDQACCHKERRQTMAQQTGAEQPKPTGKRRGARPRRFYVWSRAQIGSGCRLSCAVIDTGAYPELFGHS